MKSIFVWNVPAISNGDPVNFTQKMMDANVDTVLIKAADGAYKFNSYGSYSYFGENLKSELVDALHQKGINVYGWQFCYGNDPKGEGAIAGDQVNDLDLDGWVFDVESEADKKEKADSNGVHTCLQYKERTNKPIIMCYWARMWNTSGGQWHPDKMTPQKLLGAWDTYVDAYMPMDYWYSTNSDPKGVWWAENMLRQTMEQYRRITQKPIIPAGRSYNGDGGVVTIEAMNKFAETAEDLGCEGLSWWSAEHAIKLPGIYETIGEIFAGTEYQEPVETPVETPTETDETYKIKTTSAMYLRNKDNDIIGSLNYGAVIDVIGEGVPLTKNGVNYDMLEISAQCAEMYTEEANE